MSRKLITTLIFIIFVIIVLINHKQILRRIFPLQYQNEVTIYSKEYDIDPYIVYSIISVESKFNPFAKSSKDAKGLMQITPQTGEYIAKLLGLSSYREELLFEPKLNIRFGVYYFAKLYRDFDYNLECALAAYNGGRGNVLKWLASQGNENSRLDIDKIPFKETKNYIKKVLRKYKIYKYLYK